MSKWLVCGIFVTTMIGVCVSADVNVKSSIAVQGAKFSEPATSGSLDDGFVRGEVKIGATSDKGVSGLLHLRLQSDLSETGGVMTKIRQAYFTVPVPLLSAQIGRWYETYTPGKYFGRYLFGVNPTGSGSFKTNYSVVDGLRLSVPIIEKAKTVFHAAVLPQIYSFDETYAMLRISSQPIKQLSVNAAANLNIVSEEDDQVHRMALSAQYEFLNDFLLFAEYGIVDLSDAGENSWILAGLEIPTAGILDLLRAEIEYKHDRSLESECDIAWMVLVGKKFRGIALDIGGGADPRGLGSQSASDIGALVRISTKF